MTKKGKICLCISIVILIVLFLASSTDLLIKERENPVYEVSVLVDSEDDSGLETFKMGMDNAALRYNVDISFVTIYDEREPYRQIQLLVREIDDGAQGYIVSAENEAVMTQMMENVPIGSPVLVFGNDVESPRIRGKIAPDYEAMASDITKRMLDENPDKEKVTLVTVSKNKRNVEIMSLAIKSVCDEKGVEVSAVNLTNIDDSETLLAGLTAQGGNVIICPELKGLEAMARAAEKIQTDVPIYGSGFSSTLWKYVENGYVSATVVYNSYDAGYFSVKNIVEQLVGGYSEKDIELAHSIVDASSLYSRENATMLFPIN